MSVLGNVLWLICGGVISAAGWFLAAALCCITIIGIPIGVQCVKFGKMALWPFGTEIVYGDFGTGSFILNVIWLIFCGVELAVGFLVLGALCCITIVGIPFGVQHFKFAKLALLPFGAEIRNSQI
ncbi:MAG: YccF domain-containing protein [Anaerotignum sp.]